MSAVAAKFDEIHTDFEANITKIYQRRDLLTALDLVVHSVLQFRFQGDLVRKGWVEGLVIGDTRCGKSESVSRMVSHYKVGEVVTGENATFAGLIGGMQQTQKTWSITWGKFPLNDRRFLVIDELSGLDQMSISRMSGVRSSGVAEIIKIQTERTLARVRTLWLSNPRGKRPLAAFNNGLDAIQDLIGAPEDIARFDFAVTVASNEVPLSVINRLAHPTVEHKYNSDFCNKLIYWAWSRKPEHVIFVDGAEKRCLDVATELSKKYVAPLVEGAEQRIKVARMAVATAARVFSTDPTYTQVIVKPIHVDFVHEFLESVYTKPSMAFDVYSRAKLSDREIDAPELVTQFLDRLTSDAISLLIESQSFAVGDLCDFLDMDRDTAAKAASFMVRKKCIRKGKFGYYKLPAFIQFLRHYKRTKGLPTHTQRITDDVWSAPTLPTL